MRILLLVCLFCVRVEALPQVPGPDSEPSDESVESEAVCNALEEARARLRLLDEIRANMAEIERLLRREETGASTQSKQSHTIERIEALIELMNKT